MGGDLEATAEAGGDFAAALGGEVASDSGSDFTADSGGESETAVEGVRDFVLDAGISAGGLAALNTGAPLNAFSSASSSMNEGLSLYLHSARDLK